MNVLHPPISSNPFLTGFTSGDLAFLDSVASVATEETGRYIFKKGGSAAYFYLIQSGTIALQVKSPDRGPIPVMTLNPGEILGWSWLFPPFKWNFDALALNRCEFIAFEAEAVRDHCEVDSDFGYRLMKSLVFTMHDRLTATRLQLLRHHDD